MCSLTIKSEPSFNIDNDKTIKGAHNVEHKCLVQKEGEWCRLLSRCQTCYWEQNKWGACAPDAPMILMPMPCNHIVIVMAKALPDKKTHQHHI